MANQLDPYKVRKIVELQEKPDSDKVSGTVLIDFRIACEFAVKRAGPPARRLPAAAHLPPPPPPPLGAP